MNKEKQENFIRYLDKQTSVTEDKITQLIRDNRGDDANFEKIRANIFQMLKTVFQASLRTSADEGEQLKFFDARLKMIEEVWQTALTKASEHNNAARILQEQVKLEVMRSVRDTFEGIWGVTV